MTPKTLIIFKCLIAGLATLFLVACGGGGGGSSSGSHPESLKKTTIAKPKSDTIFTNGLDAISDEKNADELPQTESPAPAPVAGDVNNADDESNVDQFAMNYIESNMQKERRYTQLRPNGPDYQVVPRIASIDLNVDKEIPELSLITYTGDTLTFEFEKTVPNPEDPDLKVYSYYVCSHKKKLFFWDDGNPECYYEARVHVAPTDQNKNVYAFINIKSVETKDSIGDIYILYIKKNGMIRPNLAALTDAEHKRLENPYKTGTTALNFLNDTIKNPKVVGEFYYVITNERARASRFRFIMSDDMYDLNSGASVTDLLTDTNISKIPLSPPSKNALTRFTKRKTYVGVREFDYMIDSRKNPAELKKLKLNLKLKTIDEDPKQDVPLELLLDFS